MNISDDDKILQGFIMDFVDIWTIYKPEWSGRTYLVIIALALIAIVVAYTVSHRDYKRSAVFSVVLIFFLVLVYGSTVLTRQNVSGSYFEPELFWSYTRGLDMYGEEFIWEIILNILMLVPVGILFPIIFYKWKFRIPGAILFGLMISGSIEILQYITKRGLCEFDDIMHNTAGVVLGCIIFIIADYICRNITKRNQSD